MNDRKAKRIRVALLGLGREHLELLPVLHRDQRVEVAWVFAGNPESTVARLGSLFSFPVLRDLSGPALGSALAGVDILVRPALNPPPELSGVPEGFPVLTDDELANLRDENRFRWERMITDEGDSAALSSTDAAILGADAPDSVSDAPVASGADASTIAEGGAAVLEELPEWFPRLTEPRRLGIWLCERLGRCLGPRNAGLLILTSGTSCIGAYRTGDAESAGFLASARELACGLAEAAGVGSGNLSGPGTSLSGPVELDEEASELARRCGLRGQGAQALHLALDQETVAWLLFANGAARIRRLDPERELKAASDALLASRRALVALARLATTEQQARDWRRLRSVWRRFRSCSEP